MTDIVDRLRSPEVFIDMGGMTSRVAHEAAAEIERLREAVKTAADVIENYDREVITCTVWLSSNETLVDYLRAALGGER